MALMASIPEVARQKPLVSVCITTYNQKNYVATTVMSVLSQCGQGQVFDLEILVGDDCSTDGSTEILLEIESEYPKNLRIIRHEKNLGANENFKFLVGHSSGNYVAHLDGDDFWLPEKLVRQVNFLESSPDLIACYTNALVIDSKNSLVGLFTNPQPEKIDFDYLAMHGNFLNFSSMLYRAQVKPLMLGLVLPMIDYEIHLTLAQIGRLGFVNEPLACYRWMSSTSMLRHQFFDFTLAYMAALVRVLPQASSKIRQRAVAHYILTTLMKQPGWLFDYPFWQRIVVLKKSLQVRWAALLWPICILAVAGLCSRSRFWLLMKLAGPGGMPVMFPRL